MRAINLASTAAIALNMGCTASTSLGALSMTGQAMEERIIAWVSCSWWTAQGCSRRRRVFEKGRSKIRYEVAYSAGKDGLRDVFDMNQASSRTYLYLLLRNVRRQIAHDDFRFCGSRFGAISGGCGRSGILLLGVLLNTACWCCFGDARAGGCTTTTASTWAGLLAITQDLVKRLVEFS